MFLAESRKSSAVTCSLVIALIFLMILGLGSLSPDKYRPTETTEISRTAATSSRLFLLATIHSRSVMVESHTITV